MKLPRFLVETYRSFKARSSTAASTTASMPEDVVPLPVLDQIQLYPQPCSPPQSSQGKEDSTNEAPFRFLDLPFEIRIQVYSYLIPNDRVIMTGLNRSGGPNTQRCYPEILRVNRKMYAEALDEFYGRATYEVEIGIHGFWVHGGIYYLNIIPPATFHYIHHVYMRLRLKVPCLHNPSKTILGLYDCTRWLEHCFPPGYCNGKAGKLRTLHLKLEIVEQFVNFYDGKPEELQRDLVLGLKPLWDLSGLLDVSVETQSLADTLRVLQLPQTEALVTVVSGVEEFGRLLVERIGPPAALA